ncbi:hypothetical protein [[Acholeplasma] multilocale]|uniref:hypothetical protein n=1 Tax=[Acholeplasma] multilocale TaxID=264638 RepID=UPI000685BCE1|nr:hypothetical protein [[Acholeplasma] multilocale]
MKPEYNTIEELQAHNEKLTQEIKEFDKIVKDINKKIISKHWLWWLLPIVGWFIFIAITNKRRSLPEFHNALVKVKTEIARNELKIIVNNVEIEKLSKK